MGKLKTINIKGKEYVEVNERIKEFRTNKDYAGMSMTTEILHRDETTIMMRATITNKDGVVIADGIAQEVLNQKGSLVNATSHVENCQTSAWGRALGCLGIGIDVAIASAEEVDNAIKGQSSKPAPKATPANKDDIKLIKEELFKMGATNEAEALKILKDKFAFTATSFDFSAKQAKFVASLLLNNSK